MAASLLFLGTTGCSRRVSGDTSGGRPGGPGGPGNGPIAVDVVLAQEGSLRPEAEYTGTTRPTREVALRARAEGRLLSMSADVGDAVRQGQTVGRLDDALLRQSLQQAQSELLSREAEVAGARSRVGDALTQVRQAELDLTQRRADFRRNIQLYGEGYVPRRDAEAARTAERVAGQVLRSEQQQVKNLQAEVRSAEARVRAQRSVVAQEQERLSYSNLVSPLTGFVTARLTEAGNLVSVGGEVIRIGDFRWVQVDVQVSELELPQVKAGATVRVTLDALPGQTFAGRVDRISPQADPVSRLVPVAITLANPDLKIGAGLLARVRFGASGPQRVVIPETAIQRGERAGGRGAGGGRTSNAPAEPRASEAPVRETVQSIFVLEEGAPAGETPRSQAGEPGNAPAAGEGSSPEAGPENLVARAREIRVGARSDGLAEVVTGLKPGERVVSRSARPLKDGDAVVLSLLSQETLKAAGEAGPGQERSAPGASAPPNAPRGSAPMGQGEAGSGFRGPGTTSGGGARPGAPAGGGGGGFGGGGGDRPVSLPPIAPGASGSRRSGGEITATPGLSRSPSGFGRGGGALGSGAGGGRSNFGTPGGTGGFGGQGRGGFGGQGRSFGGGGTGGLGGAGNGGFGGSGAGRGGVGGGF